MTLSFLSIHIDKTLQLPCVQSVSTPSSADLAILKSTRYILGSFWEQTSTCEAKAPGEVLKGLHVSEY